MSGYIQTAYTHLEIVNRTSYTGTSLVQNMGVDHCRAHVFVPHKFLDGTDVVASLKQMRGERMPERMAADVLDDVGPSNGFLYGPLNNCLVGMVPSFFASSVRSKKNAPV